MKHIMVDCETLGLHPASVVLTIGAVEFDPYTVGALGATFHEAIGLQSSMRAGRVVDPDTLLWWLEQSDAARHALVTKCRAGAELAVVLSQFRGYVENVSGGDPKAVKLWSCGSRDLEWLESCYAGFDQRVPWGYRTGDYRTIRDEFGTKADEPAPGISHDALSDAIWQAQYLQNVFARLRGYGVLVG